MRPRLFSGERGGAIPLDEYAHPGFNEAPLIQRGKGHLHRQQRRGAGASMRPRLFSGERQSLGRTPMS